MTLRSFHRRCRGCQSCFRLRQRAGPAHHAVARSRSSNSSSQPDGPWQVTLRIQNYSTIAMQYAALHGTLHIAGVDVGNIELTPDLDIPANSADVIDAKLHGSAKLPAGDLDYRIAGTIDTSEPKENFKFDRSSRLSPAPGLPGTWR